MAYLAPLFKADAFVSYSHGDPKGQGNMPWEAWTHALVERLKTDIISASTEFKNLKIWYDEEADRTAQLTDILRCQVDESFLFIIIMSDYYLDSPWCSNEREWFRKQIFERTPHLPKGRVFVLRAQPIEKEKWPSFLLDEQGHPPLGFRLHPTNSLFPYGWPDLFERNEEFRIELLRLTMAIIERLREVKRNVSDQSNQPTAFFSAQPTTPPKLFLHSRQERKAEREAIKSALKADGIKATSYDATERDKQIYWMKQCNALALTAFDGGEADEREFTFLYEHQMDIVGPSGDRIPWVVIDRSGGRLPLDPADWDVARIDATRDNWRSELREWFDRAQLESAP